METIFLSLLAVALSVLALVVSVSTGLRLDAKNTPMAEHLAEPQSEQKRRTMRD